uniref:hypothetical protein n=1 Tax=Nonomuraea pusilla TaxID=46177 RepID=UPI0006E2F759|nr:hypothetical protein [Nonomuraea pusilla]
MADLPGEEIDAWPCAGLSPHPPVRLAAQSLRIDWAAEDQGQERASRVRVVDSTCSCCVIVYELLNYGGVYAIRRTHQTVPPRFAYAGPWPHAQARRVWVMLLSGEAR